MTVKWNWEYSTGGYTIHREDMTQQLWFQAIDTKCGNFAADALCEWLTKLEIVNTQLLEALKRIGDPRMWRKLNGELTWAGETPSGNEIETESPLAIAAAAIAAAGGQP